MSRTKQTSASPSQVLLCSVVALLAGAALLASCGPQQTRPVAVAVPLQTPPPEALVLPSMDAPVVATMSLVQESVVDLVTTTFAPEEKPSTAVAVTFRLGPKMASHTFEIEPDGSLADPTQMKRLKRLFRCRRSGRMHRINKGLLSKIADLSSHYEGHTLEVISAYRHGHNAKPKSRHRAGRAIDIRVVGVPAARVRDYLWARYAEEVGVGFYKQQQFIHLDHRKNYPATAWTQKHHSGQNDYKPRWARASRRDKLTVALAGSQH